MTCDHVREQLLELPVGRFDTLADHLERCPTCAALADRIRQQENEMDAYIDDYTHAPYEPASAPAPLRTLRWPVVGTALALAAAAALWIAAGGPPPTEAPSEHSIAAAPADDVDTIRFGIGRSVLLKLNRTPKAVSVIDPDVVAVQTMDRSNTLRLLGLAAGRSQLVHTAEDGTREVWWLEVSEDSTVPITSESDQVLRPPTTQLTVRLGERRFVKLDGIPRAVAVTDPDAVTAGMAGSATELAIDGLQLGTTDVTVHYGDAWQVWVITVEP